MNSVTSGEMTTVFKLADKVAVLWGGRVNRGIFGLKNTFHCNGELYFSALYASRIVLLCRL